MDLNSALNSLLDDGGLGLKPKKSMGSMRKMAASSAATTTAAGMQHHQAPPQPQQPPPQQPQMTPMGASLAGAGFGGAAVVSPQVSRSTSAQSMGSLSSLSATSSTDDIFGLGGMSQGAAAVSHPAAPAPPASSSSTSPLQHSPAPVTQVGVSAGAGAGQDLDDFFSGMALGASAPPNRATPAPDATGDLLGGFAPPPEMPTPAPDDAGDKGLEQSWEQDNEQFAPDEPASATGSVIVTSADDDDTVFGPGGALETEDYASARESFDERRRRNECIRHQQEEFARYERSQQPQQSKMQERLRESRERMGSFLNSNMKSFGKMKDRLVSDAREKINNFKASRSGSMSDIQQQQLQSRTDGGPKITQVAPSPSPSPRSLLVEGELGGSPPRAAASTATASSAGAYTAPTPAVTAESKVPAAAAASGDVGEFSDFLGSGAETSPRSSSAGPSASDDSLDIFAADAANTTAAPAASSANDDINALFAEPAAPPAAAQGGFDDIFGNNGVEERSGGGGGGGVSFGFEAAMSSGQSTANTVAVDANNVVQVADEQGVDGEPEIRKRLREQRIQKKKLAMAAALQQKLDKDMEDAMERAERDEVAEYKGPLIKSWAARHKDNIRGMLGTLHEVLWADSGWAPVSVTDLIEPKRVKMSFRKAMLRVHPDKVKSNGGNVEQCYIADQVFDTLNQAYSKFEKEEMK